MTDVVECLTDRMLGPGLSGLPPLHVTSLKQRLGAVQTIHPPQMRWLGGPSRLTA